MFAGPESIYKVNREEFKKGLSKQKKAPLRVTVQDGQHRRKKVWSHLFEAKEA